MKLPQGLLGQTLVRTALIAVILYAIALLALHSGYYMTIIIVTSYVFFIYSLSWMLLAYGGVASLGQAAFFGTGAYAAAVLFHIYGFSPLASLVAGPLVAAILGLAVGYISSKLREWYIGMFTFALVPIFGVLFGLQQFSYWTGGQLGVVAPPMFSSASSLLSYSVLLAAAFSAVFYFIISYLSRSKWGLALLSINDNETAAETTGINVRRFKTLAFGISGYISGFSGALYVMMVSRWIYPTIFSVTNTTYPLLFSVVGGMGSPEGVLLGTLILEPLDAYLGTSVSGYLAIFVMALLMIVVIVKSPKGLYPLIVNRVKGLMGRDQRANAEAKGEVA